MTQRRLFSLSAVAILIFAMLLAACGQKGALVLPEDVKQEKLDKTLKK